MVYLVLRSEYQEPYGRKILEFQDSPDLVSWLRAHWLTRQDLIAINPEIAKEPRFDPYDWQDEIHTLRKAVIGDTPSGLSELFVRMVDQPPPEDMDAVRKFIDLFEGDYGEGGIELNGSSIQAYTNDDEIDMAWYLFDQAFADQFPGRTRFLLHKPLELPETFGGAAWKASMEIREIGKGEGATFCCFFSSLDGSTLLEIDGCFSLPARLPELGTWLAAQQIGFKKGKFGVETDWHENLILLRAFSLEEPTHSFEKALRLFDSYGLDLARDFSDFRHSKKKPCMMSGGPDECAGDINALFKHLETEKTKNSNRPSYWRFHSEPSLFQFSPHLCQVVFAKTRIKRDDPGVSFKNTRHWIFFDDLWAEVNKELAESILRYGMGGGLFGIP
jgi:hypothetical protein